MNEGIFSAGKNLVQGRKGAREGGREGVLGFDEQKEGLFA